ncbi:TonB-dependent receptor [uncultured Aquimarina sp.]|uniref:TonB-dependent receptor n=1 Tax=uncultured Aquimarina sp. TaxID=575652 RepID=UPI002627B8AD|nr:TonB-dependent receptor [uncultured Aquimarina sp.]
MKVSQLKKNLFFLMIFLSSVAMSYAQQTGLKGKIVDASSNENLAQVLITIEGTLVSATTGALGEFDFGGVQLPLGEQIAVMSKDGYVTKRYPIVINEGSVLDLGTLGLVYDLNQEEVQIGTISLSDNELSEGDDNGSFNVSGLLQASRDVFLSAAAFDFSATFFRPRGLNSENGKVLINGIEMNKLFNGRPQWNNWGGLNDMQRNQEFTMGISANDYTFGDLSGTTNIVMRASQYREGGRVSYSASNRTYTGRVMGSYNSGLNADGFAYSVLLSRRFGDEGYVDGTLYDAYSIFASVEKKFNDKHSLNFTSFYTPNRRGRSSSGITNEMFRLKGRRYNPHWGYQDGEKRNSRVREIEEPVLMLNHYWNITEKTTLNTNVSFQTGKIGNSRIESRGTTLGTTSDGQQYVFGDASNPAPDYFRNLPSFFLQDTNPTIEDFGNAFLAEQDFINNGQYDWNSLYQANISNANQGFNSTYILYEDRTDDTQWSFNSILNSQITDNIAINAALNYRTLNSENFANVLDLLGGTGFLDVNAFAEDENGNFNIDLAQNNLSTPNRIVREGDRFRYNFEIDASVASAFAQAQFKYNKVDFYLGGNVSQTNYQRTGLYNNGRFQGAESLGKSEKLDFTNYGAKAGITYKINGRNLLDVHGAYFTKAPTVRSSFTNSRETNDVVDDLQSEKVNSIDASYIYRSPIIKARLTGYFTEFNDRTDISFFFTNGLGSFVQEILTDIDERRVGAEFGLEAQVTPTIKLKAVASVGQYTYQNNPGIEITSDDPRLEAIFDQLPDLKANLKNYHISGGPERAYQLGIEYRDPDFWWVGLTANHFSNAYIDISPLTRSDAFPLNLSDSGGVVAYSDYDPEVAKELLRQEQLDSYVLINAVGGKSWKLGDYYIGMFAGINNLLDETYRTGGYEQSRNADYRTALEEGQRDTPLFGTRYFFGNGINYFVNLSLRF